MSVKNYKVGDIIDAETAKQFEEMFGIAMKPDAETAKLPKPTHYPHLEPQTVYGIVLHDPNLRIIPAEFPERKLH